MTVSVGPGATREGDTLTATFMAPTLPLSINKAHSLHWSARRRQTNPWRDFATMMTRTWRLGVWKGWEAQPVTVQLALEFRTGARRDPHNYVGTTVKAFVDGLVSGGLIPDDTPEWATILEPVLEVQPDKSRPLMARVTIAPRSTT